MALTTTSEAGAVDRHAVVHDFVLSVADIITSALRAGALLVQAGFSFFARSIKPTSSPNRARQLVQQQGPAHVGVSLFSGEREIKPGCIPAMIMSIASR